MKKHLGMMERFCDEGLLSDGGVLDDGWVLSKGGILLVWALDNGGSE